MCINTRPDRRRVLCAVSRPCVRAEPARASAASRGTAQRCARTATRSRAGARYAWPSRCDVDRARSDLDRARRATARRDDDATRRAIERSTDRDATRDRTRGDGLSRRGDARSRRRRARGAPMDDARGGRGDARARERGSARTRRDDGEGRDDGSNAEAVVDRGNISTASGDGGKEGRNRSGRRD